jgi:hypothetical protein
MGFGTKTDYPNKRVLDLDKSYQNLIKPAVEAAGLRCIRADEITHSGSIDEKMYQQLMDADVVVADLSTSNSNAFYELGVRHALRPYTTIIISDNKLQYPFDVNHIAIRQYEHLGPDIGYSEVMRFQKVLKDAITEIMSRKPEPEHDSPVYQFLRGLRRPMIEEVKSVLAAAEAVPASETRGADADADAGPSLAALMQEANEKIANAKGAKDFLAAKFKLEEAREMRKPPPLPPGSDPDVQGRQEDPYIIQRLALATYKSKYPSVVDALQEAHDLLMTLSPKSANDPETLGLWGAVHKRLWEESGETERKYLDEAIQAYERGFYLRDDYYNGINLAFLLNIRAAKRADPAESVADFVLARRVRGEVVRICERELAALGEAPQGADKAVGDKYRETRYWILATQAEAQVGLGHEAEAKQKLDEAYEVAAADWMKESTEGQIAKLRALLVDSPLKYISANGISAGLRPNTNVSLK